MTVASWFHASRTTIKRSQGRSVVAAAAYRAGISIFDETERTTFDYTRKLGVEEAFVTTPADKPGLEWAQDIAVLSNAMETHERRKDAQVGHEWIVALPDELAAHQRSELSHGLSQKLSDLYGVAVIAAQHAPSQSGDDRNHHLHLLFTTREVEADGKLGAKVTIVTDKKTSAAEVTRFREATAELINEALEEAGSDERVDHRSFKARGVEEIPTTHLGPSTTAFERQGIETERGNRNRAIIEERLAWQMGLDASGPEITPAVERDLAARFEGWQPLERGPQSATPSSEPPDQGEAEKLARTASGDTEPLARSAPANTDEEHRGWRRFVDRVRAFQTRVSEAWDQTADATGNGIGGFAARVLDTGRKLATSWRDGEPAPVEDTAQTSWIERARDRAAAIWSNERGSVPDDAFDRLAREWEGAGAFEAEPEPTEAPEPDTPEYEGPDIE